MSVTRHCLTIMALAVLLPASPAVAQSPKALSAPTARPLPGQLIIDPEHPQWLKRNECAAWIRRQHSETILTDDSLQGKTKGKQVGGIFGAQGYQSGLGQNHILYQLPHTVREGYVEFDVKGMDAAAIPKDGDHGFLGMYDGRGVTEPAQYFRDLKDNVYRWNVHWRQDRNAMKSVISCAAPGADREKAAKGNEGLCPGLPFVHLFSMY